MERKKMPSANSVGPFLLQFSLHRREPGYISNTRSTEYESTLFLYNNLSKPKNREFSPDFKNRLYLRMHDRLSGTFTRHILANLEDVSKISKIIQQIDKSLLKILNQTFNQAGI